MFFLFKFSFADGYLILGFLSSTAATVQIPGCFDLQATSRLDHDRTNSRRIDSQDASRSYVAPAGCNSIGRSARPSSG